MRRCARRVFLSLLLLSSVWGGTQGGGAAAMHSFARRAMLMQGMQALAWRLVPHLLQRSESLCCDVKKMSNIPTRERTTRFCVLHFAIAN